MLIVPISGKIGWKNPPVVTLALVLVNCLVFFIFQSGDDGARMAAEQFYLESGLAEIEVPYYIDYLAELEKKTPDVSIDTEPDALMAIHFDMESDADFLRHLAAGKIISSAEPVYAQWRSLRQTYEEKRGRSVAFAYGLRPAFPRTETFFTYMFLHGSVGHLVGNMIFLWILGCMLEIGTGRLLFTGLYLVSGLLSAGFFWLIYPSSPIPLVGASGAIAGLMGAYTVLYGKKKVSVFYSLGFYFNTATIPAIMLLPAWLANECYQLYSGVSHVAYVAHIGGLVAGALFAFGGERLIGIDGERFEAAPEDKVSPLMHQALHHVANLELSEARALLEEVLVLSPDNHEALTHLFNIHKLNPEAADFHQTAKRLLGVLLKNNADHRAALTVYETYTTLCRRPRLSIAVYMQIAGIMAAEGQVDSAEKIVFAVLKQKPEAPGLPSSLIKLAKAFRNVGRMDRWEHCRRLVCQQFPDSTEAGIVMRSDSE